MIACALIKSNKTEKVFKNFYNKTAVLDLSVVFVSVKATSALRELN